MANSGGPRAALSAGATRLPNEAPGPGAEAVHAAPQVTSPGAAARYIPTLDGWRALAILGVIFAHGSYSLSQFLGRDVTALAYGGHGVYVFFGLSGFLITSRLLDEQARAGAISLPAFYLRRAFRILPPALLYLLCLWLMNHAGWVKVTAGELWRCVFFLRNYTTGYVPGNPQEGYYTGHFWSLAMEEHFYLLWPALLALLGPRRVVPATIALILSVAAWRTYDFHHHIVHGRLVAIEQFATRSDVRLDALLCGCLLALLLRYPRVRSALSRALPSALSPLLLLAYLYSIWRFAHDRPLPMRTLGEAIIIPLAIGATVLHPRSALSRFLDWAPMRWIGRVSYSLYLWQALFTLHSYMPRPAAFGAAQEMPFSLLPLFAVACLSYYLVEQPLIRVGQRLASAGPRRR